MTLRLGTTRRGKGIALSDEERSRHLHIIGASGTGKSKLIEHMVQQDIIAGRGLCLIDPHGTLADSIVEFCATRGLNDFRRIHVIKPADTEWSFGFNPLRLDGTSEPMARVDAMVAACAQVWGGEDTSSTPLLKKCLRAVFYALTVRELTLLEAVNLITSKDPSTIRRALTKALPDYVFDSLWEDLNALSRREFAEQFSSTNNRLLEFLSAPVVRRIVGQREHTLDLKRVMDEGEILIVNLARHATMSPDNTRLLGTLLTSELFLLALARNEKTAIDHPFYLYIDECYDFLTSDIERMLDQTRKFGLHLILAHHRLSQLRARSEAIYNGVMTGGQTKIVFGGLEDDDAEIMARQIMRGSFNLERAKHSLDKPIVVDEIPFWLDSESTSVSEGRTQGTSENSGWNTTTGLSESYDNDGNVIGSGASSGSGRSGGSSMTDSTSAGRTTSQGRSQTLKPVRITMPTAVHSLEEELHLAILKLRELPQRAAVVKRRGRPATRLVVPEVRSSLASPEMSKRFTDRTREASPYICSTPVAEAEIEARHARLRKLVSPSPSDDAGQWLVEEPGG